MLSGSPGKGDPGPLSKKYVTAPGGPGAVHTERTIFDVSKANQDTSVRRTESRQRSGGSRADKDTAGARKWLLTAHADSGSWEEVARRFGISSKGSARRIALGEADLPLAVLERYIELRVFRSAARRLWKRARSVAIARALEAPGKRVVIYSNRGKEVKQ